MLWVAKSILRKIFKKKQLILRAETIEDLIDELQLYFPEDESRATVLALLAYPRTTTKDLEMLMISLDNKDNVQNETSKVIKRIFDRLSDEMEARHVYQYLINLARKNKIDIDQDIYQEVVRFLRDSKLASAERSISRLSTI